MSAQYALNLNEVTSEKSVKLLRLILIINYLLMNKFSPYVKASNQLNAISSLGREELTCNGEAEMDWNCRKEKSSSVVSLMFILINVS